LDGTVSSSVLEAVYGVSFSVNGTIQDLDYERHESAYVENGLTARKASEIVFSFGGHTLRLDYCLKIREEA
ncbi:MAG TPA: hypothetical protein PLZ76_08160, partial [Bacillota bacterium]|nr:hypothetical protein [Bacillota bacterium]